MCVEQSVLAEFVRRVYYVGPGSGLLGRDEIDIHGRVHFVMGRHVYARSTRALTMYSNALYKNPLELCIRVKARA